MKTHKAHLLLEDGSLFTGNACGASGTTCGELVFNTAMTGYQEILTDPSYHEQLITMTYPHIGNYGTNPEDSESDRVWAKGFIVKEICETPSSWRSTQSLPEYLRKNKIVAISGLDTRAITRKIRDKGALRALITTEDLDKEAFLKKLGSYPTMNNRDLASLVSCKKSYLIEAKESKKFFVIAYDFGIKKSILKYLSEKGCEVKVVPSTTSAEEVLNDNPDGIFLSNGPGDPAAVTYAIENIKKLLDKKPIFGICLGHQLLCQALGMETYKLKFGHRGANQPVSFSHNDKIEITSHNHGFAVKTKENNKDISHTNLNDHTVEGLYLKERNILSVQYHPESSPGPLDSLYLFDEFVTMMKTKEAT